MTTEVLSLFFVCQWERVIDKQMTKLQEKKKRVGGSKRRKKKGSKANSLVKGIGRDFDVWSKFGPGEAHDFKHFHNEVDILKIRIFYNG